MLVGTDFKLEIKEDSGSEAIYLIFFSIIDRF